VRSSEVCKRARPLEKACFVAGDEWVGATGTSGALGGSGGDFAGDIVGCDGWKGANETFEFTPSSVGSGKTSGSKR